MPAAPRLHHIHRDCARTPHAAVARLAVSCFVSRSCSRAMYDSVLYVCTLLYNCSLRVTRPTTHDHTSPLLETTASDGRRTFHILNVRLCEKIRMPMKARLETFGSPRFLPLTPPVKELRAHIQKLHTYICIYLLTVLLRGKSVSNRFIYHGASTATKHQLASLSSRVIYVHTASVSCTMLS